MWQKLNQRKNTASSLLAFIYLSMQLLNILMTAGKASSLWYFPARHNILDNLFKSLYIRCEVLVYVRCSISTAAAKCWGNSPPLFLLYNQPPAYFLLNAVTEGLGEISPSLYWEGPGSTTVYRTALPRFFFFFQACGHLRPHCTACSVILRFQCYGAAFHSLFSQTTN